MSKYDKAGLVQIPSGYKAGTLYSVVPTNSNGDFDVTRASTATRVNKDGLIETVAANVPRLDYPLVDGVVQDCPALLLEPAATNVITNSNIFNANANVSVDINNTISPDGSINAVKVTGNSGTSLKLVDANGAASGTYVISVFAKKDTHNFIQLGTGGLGVSANFDLNNGVSSSNGSIQDYGNGWYRCSFQQTTGSPSSHYISLIDNMSATRLANSSTTNSVFLYGFQSENSSYITSYIPTSGSAVTRIAETCNGAGTSAEFNDSEGVLFIEANGLGSTGNLQFGITNGSNDNEAVKILYYLDNTVRFEMKTLSGTNFVKDVDISHTRSEIFKGALQYKSNEYKVFANGFKYNVTQTSATPTGLSDLRFNTGNNASPFYGNTKQVITFKEALSDTELESLTSWDSFNEMALGQGYSIK